MMMMIVVEELEFDCDVCEELCEHPHNICVAKTDAISDEEAQLAAETFKLLGDATRLKPIKTRALRLRYCVSDSDGAISRVSPTPPFEKPGW